MGVDAIVSLVSLFGPKIFDTIKGFIHRKDSPDATMAALAQTNPAELSNYVNAQAALITAQNASINADITGTPHQWVSDVRALIRPVITVIAMVHIIVAHFKGIPVPEAAMYTYEAAISSWFGSRLK